MNNTDKHRIIPITTTAAFVGHLRMFRRGHVPVDILPWQEEVGEHLTDGLEIARIPMPDDMDGATFDLPIGMDVAFEQIGGLARHPMKDLLVKATGHVNDLVESFRGEFSSD